MQHQASRTQEPESVRCEYAALANYTSSIANTRFTIVGLYVATVGMSAGTVLSHDYSWLARMSGSLVLFWITICVLVLEWRIRTLLKNLCDRGIEIEHREWGQTGESWYTGFFNRQFKKLPQTQTESIDVPEKPQFDSIQILWMDATIPDRIARYISHSLAFDLLYMGCGIFWLLMFFVSLYRVMEL